MKSFVYCILFALSTSLFFACEKTYTIGGYATTNGNTPDTIPGLAIGLYKYNGEGYDEETWSGWQLLEETITDEDGFFTMTFDEGINISGARFFIKQATDTNQVHAKYSNSSINIRFTDYSKTKNLAKFAPSANYWFVFSNFDFETNLLRVAPDPSSKLLPGKTYTLKVYKRTGDGQQELLGEVEKYFPIVLPVKSDKVEWDTPLVFIVIDKNELK